jgi:hypothetical protein
MGRVMAIARGRKPFPARLDSPHPTTGISRGGPPTQKRTQTNPKRTQFSLTGVNGIIMCRVRGYRGRGRAQLGSFHQKKGAPLCGLFWFDVDVRWQPRDVRSRALHGVQPFYKHSPCNMALPRLYHRSGINFAGGGLKRDNNRAQRFNKLSTPKRVPDEVSHQLAHHDDVSDRHAP